MKTPSSATSTTSLGFLLLPILLAAGCAGARPYYSSGLFEPPTIDETDRSRMVIYLDWVIRNQRVKQITMITPEDGQQSLYPRDDSSPPTIDWLPLPVLYAASYILSPKRKGVEADLLVHTDDGGYTPVTALQELDGSVRIEMGKALKSLLPPSERQPTREEIVQRFRVSAVRDGTQHWQPLELASLEQALTLLSPQERSILSDVSFVRNQEAATASGGSSSGRIWGRYYRNIRSTQGRAIHFFDTRPGADTSRFVGQPDHPYPFPTLCLLHEIGHAIADYARVRILHRIAALKAEDAELARSYLADLKLYQREGGPVIAAYAVARGPEKGPTLYGRTDIEESFAESFALYKADPEALRRIYPDLYEWFASGLHIKALRDALGEDVGPLSHETLKQN